MEMPDLEPKNQNFCHVVTSTRLDKPVLRVNRTSTLFLLLF